MRKRENKRENEHRNEREDAKSRLSAARGCLAASWKRIQRILLMPLMPLILLIPLIPLLRMRFPSLIPAMAHATSPSWMGWESSFPRRAMATPGGRPRRLS